MEEDPFITELIRVAEQNIKRPGYSSAVPIPLISSGGWCAPSAPIYDLSSTEAFGLLDLPSIQIRRGGITWHTRTPRPLPKFENCPSFGPPIGMLKPLEMGLFL